MQQIIYKVRLLLNRGQKIRVIILIILMIIGACFETIGVSLIIPLVSAIVDENIMKTNQLVSKVCSVLGIVKQEHFVIFILIALILTYVVKNIYLFLLYSVQYRFIYNNQFQVAYRLMNAYLKKPYEYYLNVNTSIILRIVSGDVNNVFSLIASLMLLISEIIVFCFLILLLLVIDPVMTISIAVILGISVLLVFRILKPPLKRAGIRAQESNTAMYHWLLQSINGIKEVKVENKEDYFLSHYMKSGQVYAFAMKRNSILSNAPRLVIETIFIVGMLGIILIMVIRGKDISGMVAQLSAFALAAVRLMPSANRINSYMNTMAFHEPSLDKVRDALSDEKREEKKEYYSESINSESKNNTSETFHFTKSIMLHDITYAYPNAEAIIFDHANMEIPKGKSIAIIGSSGAGKTMVVDLLLGLLKLQEGQVLLDGMNISDYYKEWLSIIGYIPQTIYLLDDTIKANVAFGVSSDEIDEKRIYEVLRETQLKDYIENLPEGINTMVGERGVRLSGGQRQRIGIARAIYRDPELLLFDEATSALDNETETAIMESINQFRGKKQW